MDFQSVGPPAGRVIPAGATYAVFDVVMNPQPAFQAAGYESPGIAQKAGVRVQLVINPATGTRHANHTAANVIVFDQMFQAVDNATPLVGINQSAEDRFSIEGWEKWTNKRIFEGIFNIATAIFCRTYVGEGLISTAVQRLQMLTQAESKNSKQTVSSVSPSITNALMPLSKNCLKTNFIHCWPAYSSRGSSRKFEGSWFPADIVFLKQRRVTTQLNLRYS